MVAESLISRSGCSSCREHFSASLGLAAVVMSSAGAGASSEISPASFICSTNIMTSLPAIRHVASSAKSALSFIHIQCHVKPGASKQREGIISVSESIIEVCVSAQPRDGEANKAVRELFSKVS